MIMQALQKLLHQVRATILLAIICEFVEFTQVILVNVLVCVSCKVDIDSRAGTPFIDTALNLVTAC
jgi:hypothetical protein